MEGARHHFKGTFRVATLQGVQIRGFHVPGYYTTPYDVTVYLVGVGGAKPYPLWISNPTTSPINRRHTKGGVAVNVVVAELRDILAYSRLSASRGGMRLLTTHSASGEFYSKAKKKVHLSSEISQPW